MALQYHTGFEDGTLLNGIVISDTPTNESSTPHTGDRYLGLLGTGDEFTLGFPTNLAATADECIVGFAIRAAVWHDSAPMAYVKFGAATSYIRMIFNTSGAIVVDRDNQTQGAGTTLATSAASLLQINTWHYVELKCIFSDTVGIVEVQLDGVEVINQTGLDSITAGSGEVGRTLGLRAPANATDLLIDDVYLLDPTGESAPFDDFLGPVGHERLEPSADSLVTGWTQSGGGTHAADIDEVPVVDTDYIENATTAQDARFTADNTADASDNIISVKAHAIAKIVNGTGPRSLAPFLRSDISGTPTDSAKTGSALATGNTEVYQIFVLDPDTGSAWADAAAVDDTEVGLRVTA